MTIFAVILTIVMFGLAMHYAFGGNDNMNDGHGDM